MVCFDFADGNCRRGKRCKYSHVDIKRKERSTGDYNYVSNRINNSRSTRSLKIDNNFREKAVGFDQRSRGKGRLRKRGDNVYVHNKAKKRCDVKRRDCNVVCYDWQDGICNRGVTCRFLHGDSKSNQGGSRSRMRRGLRNRVHKYKRGEDGDCMEDGHGQSNPFDFQKASRFSKKVRNFLFSTTMKEASNEVARNASDMELNPVA